MNTAPTTITVYTGPGCHRCHATLRQAERRGMPVTVVDTATDTAAGDRLRSSGFSELPVVEVTDAAGEVLESWSGYRHDLIDKYAAVLAAQSAPDGMAA